MPILKNAQKALRSSQRKAAINNRVRSQMKTAVTKAKSTPTAEFVSAAFSRVDVAAKKNIIHPNKAARIKKQLARPTTSA